MTYDAIHSNNNNRSRSKSRNKNQGHGRSQSSIRNCKYCGKSHDKGSCPAFGKECSKCGKKNHFKAVCKSNGSNEKQDQSKSRPKKGKKWKKFHEINEAEKNENGMDDLADQVQSPFYHDVHFNNVNKRMHTELGCETRQNRSNKVFKIDMGADGNLMPITMFMKLYPKISLETLAKTIDKGITLFAYNNTPIKQYGTCSVKITFNGKQEICKFYVVEYTTAILGVSDSEKLGLIKVNFDVIQSKMVKIVHNIILSVKLNQSTQNYLKE